MDSTNPFTQEERRAYTNKLAERALELYDLSPSAYCRILNYSENTTYLVEDPKRGGERFYASIDPVTIPRRNSRRN